MSDGKTLHSITEDEPPMREAVEPTRLVLTNKLRHGDRRGGDLNMMRQFGFDAFE